MASVLVIDDDSDFLNMISLLLQRGGHQAILSADGTEGLEKAIANPPDLVILDVMMPGITGYEICRKLRDNPATASVPIIILTARGQPVDRQAALDAGADEYMSKPVTMIELSEHIEALLEENHTEQTPLLSGTVVLLSLRGGVGTTTLATNLAALLAQSGDKNVCLIDLCPSSGHAALQLGLRPEPNWTGLRRAGEINTQVLDAHLLKHDSGLHVLASPVFPVARERALSRATTQATFNVLQQGFSTIVVDAAPVLDEATAAAVEAASVVGLVVTAEPPSIQTAVGTMRAFKNWFAKFRIILNQVNPGPQPPVEAIQRTLKRPVVGAVPFDSSQAQALTQGAPLALQNPSSPLVQGVKTLIEGLT